jgi:orotate phosphoribosyltransferase
MQQYQREFVDFLVEAGALKIGEFRLKSGRLSPLFLNTGLLDTGARLVRLGRGYAETMLAQVGPEDFDVVFGPAYKGIPLAVAACMALAEKGVDKTFLADRKEAKAHGAEAGDVPIAKKLLGRPPAADARFVVVDDVLTDGATKREAVELLRAAAPDCTVAALLIVLDRQEMLPDGRNACAAFAQDTGVPVLPVVSVTEVIDYLAERGHIDAADVERCRAYWGEYGTAEAKAWAAGAAV